MTLLRRTAVTVAVAVAALLPMTASADPPQSAACSPTAATFCISYGAAVYAPGTATPETRASAPVDLSLALTNTSPTHESDELRWLKSLSVQLFSGGAAGPQLTPSSQLPDSLLLAGSAAGCAPGADSSFSACSAGHGSVLLNVSNVPTQDGFKTATFGIQRITNVHATSNLGEYRADVIICVPIFGSACLIQQSTSIPIVVPSSSGTASLTIPTGGTFTFNNGVGGTGSADYALDSASLNLSGSSDTLGDGGPAGQAYTVLRLPASCGTVSATGDATSTANAVLSISQTLTLTSCPTLMAASATVSQSVVADFSATAASVPGRSIAAYEWKFGDGTTTTTAAATVRHTYASAAPRGVIVTAIDTFGARSAPLTVTLSPSALTEKGPKKVVKGKKVKLKGLLTSNGAGLGGRTVRLLRCKPSGAGCQEKATATTAGDGTYKLATKVKKTALYEVVFDGGPGTYGSAAAAKVKVVKPHR